MYSIAVQWFVLTATENRCFYYEPRTSITWLEVVAMLPTNTTPSTWTSGIDLPSRLFGADGDYELYEEDGEFVLSIEMPGFEPGDIDVRWYEGRLRVSAEHEDDEFDRKKTYHRTFRLPKAVVDENIGAEYESGVLRVSLPIEEDVLRGKQIEVQS
jgi:HSP20 family protein